MKQLTIKIFSLSSSVYRIKSRNSILQQGFTLIELVIFIVVVGIALAAVVVPLNLALEKSSNANYQLIALGYAQERMELILGQRYLKGFDSFNDPCTNTTPPSICTTPANYSVNAAITPTTISGDSGYKTIQVTVSGLGNASLTTLVGSY